MDSTPSAMQALKEAGWNVEPLTDEGVALAPSSESAGYLMVELGDGWHSCGLAFKAEQGDDVYESMARQAQERVSHLVEHGDDGRFEWSRSAAGRRYYVWLRPVQFPEF